jgi:DNA polymerase III sliding clamp (beta) subunit (PCNA family)
VIFSCPRTKLAAALDRIAPAVDNRASIKALARTLVVAGESGVHLFATDLDQIIRAELEADVAQPGQIVLDHKLLSRVVGGQPGERVKLQLLEDTVKISAGGTSKLKMPMRPEDFPPLDALTAGGEPIARLDPEKLRAALSFVAWAVPAPGDPVLPVWASIRFDGEVAEVYAANGPCVARAVIDAEPWLSRGVSSPAGEWITIQRDALPSIPKLDGKKVEIVGTSKHVRLEAEGGALALCRPAREVPDLASLLAPLLGPPEREIQVNREALLGAIKAVLPTAESWANAQRMADRMFSIRLRSHEGELEVYAHGDAGSTEIRVPADCAAGWEAKVQSAYLSEPLERMPAKIVKLAVGMARGGQSIRITPSTNDRWAAFVSPMMG